MTAALSPWTDPRRFGQRQFHASLRRGLQPAEQRCALASSVAQAVAALWASQLCWPDRPVLPTELVLCGSGREALALALATLLVPGDTVLIGHPTAGQALAIALAQGAHYIDVGRTDDGQIDFLAAQRAAQAHPQAVAYGQAPAWSAVDDTAMWQQVTGLRATVADLRLALWPTVLPAAGACVLSLRDPDDPACEVLYAVVAPQADAVVIAALWGDSALSHGQLRHAHAVAGGMARNQLWVAQARSAVLNAAGRLTQAALGYPGVQTYATAGATVALRCRGGDGASLFAALRIYTPDMATFDHHPLRGWVVADVAAAALSTPSGAGQHTLSGKRAETIGAV